MADRIVRKLVLKKAFKHNATRVSFSDGSLEEVDWRVIDAMGSAGALVRSTVEFGEVLLAVNFAFIKWATVSNVYNPIPMGRVASSFSIRRESKMELIMWLTTEGWEATDAVPEPDTEGGSLLYRHGLSGVQQSYLACIAESVALFTNG